jgi:two-component system response regulator AlgR
VPPEAGVSAALRVVLVDDEVPARARLKELIADCAPQVPAVVVGEAGNGKEALELLASVSADLLLVDIRMPQMSGIEFARHALVLQPPPAIIFITAYDEYAIKAFEVRALDYLLKPVRRARLQAALARARGLAAPSGDALRGLETAPRRHLPVPERGRIRLVPIDDILYLKAELKYVTVRTAEREYLLEESLSHLEQEFAAAFVRVHRNCLVAKARIRGFEKAEVQDGEQGWAVLLDGCAEKLAVSRRQWPQVKELAKG